ncbi:MAG: hypothetical protein ACXADY_23975 [Candidatus Hodarchaeales archaeon]|jgi:hypothetical protein
MNQASKLAINNNQESKCHRMLASKFRNGCYSYYCTPCLVEGRIRKSVRAFRVSTSQELDVCGYHYEIVKEEGISTRYSNKYKRMLDSKRNNDSYSYYCTPCLELGRKRNATCRFHDIDLCDFHYKLLRED